MFNKKTLAASLFLSLLTISGTASANDAGVAAALSAMMKNAVTQTAQEIDLELKQSIVEIGQAINTQPSSQLLSLNKTISLSLDEKIEARDNFTVKSDD